MSDVEESGKKQKIDSKRFINSRYLKEIQHTAETYKKMKQGLDILQRAVPLISIPINRNVASLIEHFSSEYKLSDLLFKNYLTTINLVEQLKEVEKSDFEYKWLGEMSYSDLMSLYDIHKIFGKGAVDSYFLNYFRKEENISKIIKSLQTAKYFEKRIIILQDALYAHMNRKYTLSIPVLYSQIDGVVVDIAIDGGVKIIEIKDKTNPKKPKIVFQTKDGKKVRNYDFANVIDEYNETKNFFFEKLAKYLKDDLYFERNNILHGRKIDYYNEKDSMRLILILLELKGEYTIV